MKKILLVSIAVLTIASLSFAADFAPTVMTLTSPAEIDYQFDGDLTIPFSVSGTPAAVWLIINTKGKAADIVGVRNGFLGWHYVNKIDTTVYISDRYSRDIGETTITWSGNDQDGNAVAAGTYDYYLWAYDNQTPRQLACQFVMLGYDWEAQFSHVLEVGEDGLALPSPMLIGSPVWWFSGTTYGRYPHGTHYKWSIGGDPSDEKLLQTTWCNIYVTEDIGDSDFTYGGPVLNPTDYNTFYHCCVNIPNTTASMLKWEFVSNGEAIQDEDWLGWDELIWEQKGDAIGVWSQKPSSYTDGEYIYVQSCGLHQKEEQWNRLRVVTFDGEVIMDKQMEDWFMPDDPNPHGYINGSFHLLGSRTPYNWFLLSHTSCLHQMIDTTRLVVDPDDETDMVMFENRNGDYFMDSAYSPDVEPAWYCLADDKTTSMRRDSIAIDRNGINVIGTSYYGLISFGISTQDGTGIADCMFSDDTVSDDKNLKGGGLLCDSQSNFDGLYYCGPLAEDTSGWTNPEIASTWFCAFDSAHGIITDEPGQVAVEEDAQAAFAVAQNSPNPFNPTTSISFTVQNADQVTVEVYNVAGQKIDTLVNDFMDAGTHSVVWDASGLSNGVYFYTVKSGDFSKTMKMTLLK